MNTFERVRNSIVCFVASFAIGSAAQADLVEVKMCAFDPIGGNGPIYQILKDYAAKALEWGAKIELRAVADEQVAADSFKAGVCDMVNLSGLTSRNFVSFPGSIDSIGSIPSYEHLKIVLSTLASEKAAKYMKEGEFEVASIVPAGSVFAFVTDRGLDRPEKLAGKKVAVLDNTPELIYLVGQVGMTPVGSTFTNYLSKFNNHSVDMAGAPAVAYEPFELHKGLEPDGGIIKFPLAQATLQIVFRTNQFPEGFGQQSRSYTATNYDSALETILSAENRIPEKYWIPIPEALMDEWMELFRNNRIHLRDQGVYNGQALTLFRKVRCKLDSQLAECTAANKE